MECVCVCVFLSLLCNLQPTYNRTVLQIFKSFLRDFINAKNVQWITQEHDSSLRDQLLTYCHRVWNLILHTSNVM